MEDRGNDTGVWAILPLLIMPLICCGGPALVALLGATGIGAVFAGITKYWIVGGDAPGDRWCSFSVVRTWKASPEHGMLCS